MRATFTYKMKEKKSQYQKSSICRFLGSHSNDLQINSPEAQFIFFQEWMKFLLELKLFNL